MRKPEIQTSETRHLNTQTLQIRLWSVGSGAGLLVIKGHSKVVTCVAVTADGSKLLSCSSDTTVKLWDIGSGEELACAEGEGPFTVTLNPKCCIDVRRTGV